MSASRPKYQLLAEAAGNDGSARWRFVLRTPEGAEEFAAEDLEPETRLDRVELLAVVRGLEALDHPSQVTVLTPSEYVRQGLAYGLDEWRRSGWTWDHFGQLVLVRNHDLWRRLDRALGIHQVECRTLRVDAPHAQGRSAAFQHAADSSKESDGAAGKRVRTMRRRGRTRAGSARPASETATSHLENRSSGSRDGAASTRSETRATPGTRSRNRAVGQTALLRELPVIPGAFERLRKVWQRLRQRCWPAAGG